MVKNFLLLADQYKIGHWKQYPPNTRKIYSYLESRGGDKPATVFFGLQYYLKKYLSGVVITQEMIEYAEQASVDAFGHNRFFNRKGWQHILDKHEGRLPVKIRAVKEGSLVPTGNVLMTIENTDPEVPWLTNFVETLLMKVWYTTSVATLSYYIREDIRYFADLTGGSVSPFHLNDFGYRGVSSEESAGLGGLAHLIAFYGTDTTIAIEYAKDYYGVSGNDTYGHSVFATEHSTTTSYGEENEFNAVSRFIEIAGPGAIVSIVSDSYDYRSMVELGFCDILKNEVLEHGKSGGRVVIRPDSGDPVEETIWTLHTLEKYYQIEVNNKGYKVLPPCIGIIYGDGLSEEMIHKICQAMLDNGWAIDGRNVVFGMGGGLLQSTNRDTHKFAIKCSARLDSEGVWHDVFKNPKTMTSKASKRGRLLLQNTGGSWETKPYNEHQENALDIVFQDGDIVRAQTLTDIRNILNASQSVKN